VETHSDLVVFVYGDSAARGRKSRALHCGKCSCFLTQHMESHVSFEYKNTNYVQKKIFISKYRYWSVFNPSELDVHLTLLNDSRLLLSELSENKVMFPKC